MSQTENEVFKYFKLAKGLGEMIHLSMIITRLPGKPQHWKLNKPKALEHRRYLTLLAYRPTEFWALPSKAYERRTP